jgi:hypothetical protein
MHYHITPEKELPTDGNALVTDRLMSEHIGLSPTQVANYRRKGFLPPFDVIMSAQGHGAWRWSTVGEFVRLARASGYHTLDVPGHTARIGLLRPVVAQLWPERAAVLFPSRNRKKYSHRRQPRKVAA